MIMIIAGIILIVFAIIGFVWSVNIDVIGYTSTWFTFILLLGVGFLISGIYKRYTVGADENDEYLEDVNYQKVMNALNVLNYKIENFISTFVKKDNVVMENFEDDNYFISKIIDIYHFFKPNEEDIKIERFKTSKRQQCVIVGLPNIEIDEEYGYHPLQALAFVDLGESMRFFKLKSGGNIESISKTNYPIQCRIENSELTTFKRFLTLYSE